MRWTSRAALAAGASAIAVLGLTPQGAGASGYSHSGSWSHHGASSPVVVVSGLNNPRQLAWDGGRLLIAEAGKGGSTLVGTSPEGTASYIGLTGSISSVWNARWAQGTTPHRIVTGLMSVAGKDGSAATGSDGVAPGRHGSVLVQETYVPSPLAPPDQNGKLLAAWPYSSHFHTVADITAFEQANDPDGMGVDSDPYAVINYRDGQLVADAAANDVLYVNRWGRISVFHVFHNVTTGACGAPGVFDPTPAFPGCNFVPTSLATDRWGHVFVGGLSSLTPGEAQVVELDRYGNVLCVLTGFSAVTGVAVAHDGTLYVSQLLGTESNPPNPMVTGLLTRVDRWGHRDSIDVPAPAGIVIADRHGDDHGYRWAPDYRHGGSGYGHHHWGNTLFVSAFSIAPDTGMGLPNSSGQVWRLTF